jgi:putative sporulation protein YyaC
MYTTDSLRVHYNDSTAINKLSDYLKNVKTTKPLKFICIGTDRSTGDSLGPLVGTYLSKLGYDVVGTVDEPLHASNLVDTLYDNNCFKDYTTIAIDACLGKEKSIGYINIKEGSLQPGTGVNKELPAIGDYSIYGVVNIGGFMEYMVLQNTRLSLVMNLAEVITNSIKNSFPIPNKSNVIVNSVENKSILTERKEASLWNRLFLIFILVQKVISMKLFRK